MDLAELQHAIEELPDDQQTALATWLIQRDRTRWDDQIERDFSLGGAGMDLLQRVKGQVRKGESRPFSEGRHRT